MNSRDSITRQDLIDYMNDLMQLDPDWVRELVNFRPACNAKIALHPSVQAIEDNGKFKAGIVGLLNGLFGPKPTIAFSYPEGLEGKPVEFVPYTSKLPQGPNLICCEKNEED